MDEKLKSSATIAMAVAAIFIAIFLIIALFSGRAVEIPTPLGAVKLDAAQQGTSAASATATAVGPSTNVANAGPIPAPAPTATSFAGAVNTIVPLNITIGAIASTPVACPSASQAKTLIGIDLVSMSGEACGFSWDGKDAADAVCPKDWLCVWTTDKNGRLSIIQEGANQAARVYKGEWRYVVSYPAQHPVQNVCGFVQTLSNGKKDTYKFQPIAGGKTCS